MNWKLNIESKAQDDIRWYQAKDSDKYNKCKKLLEEIALEPTKGTGKPERLKYAGEEEKWSRRVSAKDRIVYRIWRNNKEVGIISCKGHYED